VTRRAAAFALLHAASCTRPAAPPEPTPIAAAAVAAASPQPPRVNAPRPASVRVTVTGIVTRDRHGALEICAGEAVRRCPGIRLLGTLAPELVSTRQRPVVVRLTGPYDGATLAPSEALLVGAPVRSPKPTRHCPAPSRAPADAPSPAVSARAGALQERYADRLAGAWWDRERRLYTIWLTGDVNVLESAGARAGVCMLGGAPHSARELDARLAQIQSWLTQAGVDVIEAGVDVLENRVRVRVESIDPAQLARVHAIGGDAVGVVSFIELGERSLAELPRPPTRGDVPLITSPLRSSYASMHALGHFAVRLDEAARCVYLEAVHDGGRSLPLWPFGYAAFTAPLRIVDYDDVVVAREGEPLAFGGGSVPVPAALVDRACGAQSAWSGAPSSPLHDDAGR
jgi:hypothetical protein